MADRCLLYYITDRTAFAGDERSRRARLLEKIAEATQAGVDYIQLREKDLPARELESLAQEAVSLIGQLRTENRELRTALLINSRTDVALAVGADGVHLRSDDITAQDVRVSWQHAGTAALIPSGDAPCLASFARHGNSEIQIGISCHNLEEVQRAAAQQASFAVFAPVFQKKDAPGTHSTGLTKLGEACKSNIPVLALGGITLANADSCLEAGAAGIAAIRLFQENDISALAKLLRRS